MTRGHFVRIGICLIALILLGEFAVGNPITPEGRRWVVRCSLDQPQVADGPGSAKGTAAPCPVSGALVSESSGTLNIQFKVESKSLRRDDSHAIHLFCSDAWDSPPPRLRINDMYVDFQAVPRQDGWVYLLPRNVLVEGVNTLEIISATELPWLGNGFEIFTLRSVTEEIHFAQTFADGPRERMVQPSKHPSQDGYDVIHYDIKHIVASMTSTAIQGEMTMTAQVTAYALSEVALDFNYNDGAFQVSAVDDGGNPPQAIPFVKDYTNRWVIATFPEAMHQGDMFNIHVTYGGIPKATVSGPFGVAYVQGYHATSHPVIYSFSQPYGARTWWPCKDTPDDKALVDMQIECPCYYVVDGIEYGVTTVSNGNLLRVVQVCCPGKCEVLRWNWRESYPISTYGVSVALANYLYVPGTYTSLDERKKMPVGHYIYPENQAAEGDAVSGTLEAMRFFARTFREYPFLDEKYVTASFNASGMEHQTCTSLGGGRLRPGGLSWINIHELAHQWFGDFVTCRNFNHVWIQEGYATYCEALFQEYKEGSQAYANYANGWYNALSDAALVYQDADAFQYSLVYQKGAFVLHMLRHIVGDEIFIQASRNFLGHHEGGTAVTADLQSEFEALYGASLDYFFQEWVYRSGRPNYVYDWQPGTNAQGNFVQLTLWQTQDADPFIMPIDIHISDQFEGKVIYTVWNDRDTQSFTIPVGTLVPVKVEVDPDNYVIKTVAAQPNAPPSPTLLSVTGLFDPQPNARLRWVTGGASTAGFRLMMSQDLKNWSIVADESRLSQDTATWNVAGLDAGRAYYFYLQSVAINGTLGGTTDTYGVMIGERGRQRVLIVDGLDKPFADRPAVHAWAARFGQSVFVYGAPFDTCANESVIDQSVWLPNYKAVLWVLGEEGTYQGQAVYNPFDYQEQPLVSSYLNGGGRLFASGAEITWDLDSLGYGRSFCRNYLKESYKTDDSKDYTVDGVQDSIFQGMSFGFDDGTGDSYFADWPDVVSPEGGGIAALNYSIGKVAGVQFEGLFPYGTRPGNVVVFGFGFETIQGVATRDEVMRRILTFFQVSLAPGPQGQFWFLH